MEPPLWKNLNASTTLENIERRPPGLSVRLTRAFARDQSDALMLAAKVRMIALTPIVVWLLLQGLPTNLANTWQVANAAVFLPISILHFYAARHGSPLFRWVYALFALDVAVMGFFFATPNPFITPPLPHAAILDFAPFFWFFFFLIHAAFSSNWRLVVWTGGWIMGARACQIAWIATRPETTTEANYDIASLAGQTAALSDPNFLFVFARIGDLVGVASFTIAAAFLVWRSHQVLERQVLAERARAQISQYVPTAVVDEVLARPGNFVAPREADVGVLFVDTIGFTGMAETMTPIQSIEFLRQLHKRLADAVFAHNGAVDKFMGDGLMATFGATMPDSAAAQSAPADAVKAGTNMVLSIAALNQERRGLGLTDIVIGVGVDYGPVITGDVGNDRRLEFTVFGDTVNVAARIEEMTRAELAPMLISARAYVAACNVDRSDNLASNFVSLGQKEIRGRAGRIELYALASDFVAKSGHR